MAISLQLPERIEPVTKKFKIPSNIAEEFDLYVQAAQESQPDVDADIVIQAILEATMKKDRDFRSWLKKKRKNGDSPAKTKTATPAPNPIPKGWFLK